MFGAIWRGLVPRAARLSRAVTRKAGRREFSRCAKENRPPTISGMPRKSVASGESYLF
jgi:hypothetical protein